MIFPPCLSYLAARSGGIQMRGLAYNWACQAEERSDRRGISIPPRHPAAERKNGPRKFTNQIKCPMCAYPEGPVGSERMIGVLHTRTHTYTAA